MIELLITLTALVIFNPARGGDWLKPVFNWYTQTLFYGLAAYALSGMWFVGVLVALQWAFLWLTGTGGLHQAFTSIVDPKEFKPFDWLAHKLANLTWKGKMKYHNLWGIWYGTLVGILMGIPLLGLLCRATIYWKHNWRITEGLIALYYWLTFILIITYTR
jgi:hypothetical protein